MFIELSVAMVVWTWRDEDTIFSLPKTLKQVNTDECLDTKQPCYTFFFFGLGWSYLNIICFVKLYYTHRGAACAK